MFHGDLEAWASKLAGVAGALVSVRFLSGPLGARLIMAAGGAIFSYYAAEFVSAKTSLPEGLAGFLLGLFGMSFLSRVWEWFQQVKFDLGGLFKGVFKNSDNKPKEPDK